MNPKKYLAEIICLIIIAALIFSTVFFYIKYKGKNEEIKEISMKNDTLTFKLRNDSTAVILLEEANKNCLNSTAAKIDYYESKIKSINRQVDKNKLIIDRLQQQKNDIDQQIIDVDSTILSPIYLLKFINEKY